ncbi:MAG: phosphoglucomutase/phosphomannomutase family protein [candidate division NC10 bacterium]|nr:phosphoglucomutase/phosphomannomutase family protein [candidate division NC10 bacterium]
MTQIQFGTSGWRGIIADEVTFPMARVVVQGIADHVKAARLEERGIVVGYDTRFLADRFAQEAAKVLAANRIRVFLCDRETPTPVVAYEILRRQAGGAINITASHNPPEWSGIKFSTATGGPALPEVTRFIEARANERWANPEVETLEIEAAEKAGLLTMIDPLGPYFMHLRSLVDFEAIRRAGLRVVVDLLFGTGRGYLDEACRDAGCEVDVLHDWRDPLFGGAPPDPTPKRLLELGERVRKRKAHLGLATDGDADRFGVVDSDGSVVSANQILALLLKHLLTTRPFPGGVARSVATTHLLDAVARQYHVPLHETPVGFKYLGELITQGKVILAGEESAGLSIRGHVPEKDGILACLLVAEMVAKRDRASLSQLLDELYAEVGTILSRRIDLNLKPEEQERLLQKLQEPPPTLIGRRVEEIQRVDGTKLLLEDGSWLLIRPSGTEPVVRLYVEAKNAKDLEKLTEAGQQLVYGS